MLRAVAAFVRLSRLEFLLGGFAGTALGTAVARYTGTRVGFRAWLLAQAAVTAFQLMTTYANEYFDRAADRLAVRTPYSGGSGVLVEGALAPRVAIAASLVCGALGAAASLALALAAHRPLAAALAAAMGVLAWAYSAPPVRLLARGLGELDTALVVAVLVPLCACAAQDTPLRPLAALATLPGAFAMLAMMVAVQLPDLAADAAGGKRNLVVRLGAARAGSLGIAAAAAVYAALALAVLGGMPPGAAIVTACSLPLAAGYARTLAARADGEAIAARGVGLFFVVTLFGALGWGAAPDAASRVRARVARGSPPVLVARADARSGAPGARPRRETNAAGRAVMGP